MGNCLIPVSPLQPATRSTGEVNAYMSLFCEEIALLWRLILTLGCLDDGLALELAVVDCSLCVGRPTLVA